MVIEEVGQRGSERGSDAFLLQGGRRSDHHLSSGGECGGNDESSAKADAGQHLHTSIGFIFSLANISVIKAVLQKFS